MAVTEYEVYVWPIDVDNAITDEELSVTGSFNITDAEGDHPGNPMQLFLGCGYIGKAGVPFNLCSATGTSGVGASRRLYTYGHG